MRKRQFGKGRLIYAAEHNTAQDYTSINLQEIVQDIGLYGIISGANVVTSNDEFYIDVPTTVCRDYVGNRIYIPTLQKFNASTVSPLLSNQEVYVTVYAKHKHVKTEQDLDSDDVVYYKDWVDGYEILKIQGTIDTIGSANPPAVPSEGVLLADVLINGTMVVLTNSDIDLSRQVHFTDEAGTNLTLTGDITVQGSGLIQGGLDLANSTLTNIATPTTDDHVGDRGYNDARYVNVDGDTMTGDFEVPNINVPGETSTGTLHVTGITELDGQVTAYNSIIVNGNSRFEDELQINGNTIGYGDATFDGRVTGRSIFVEWYGNKDYEAGVLVTHENKIYQCVNTHTSDAGGDFLVDIANWKLAGGGGGTVFDINIPGHGFSLGECVRIYDSTLPNPFTLAIADEDNHKAMFIVSAVADADNFTIMSSGYIEGLTGLTQDKWHYLSAGTPGALTLISPSISQKVLYATSTSTGYVFPLDTGGGGGSGSVVYTDSFTATTGQTVFTLENVPAGKDYIWASIDGASQNESEYSVFLNDVTFTDPMVGGEEVQIKYIVSVSLNPEGNVSVDEFVATEGQTTFTLSLQPKGKNYLNVDINGFTQHEDSFSINDSSQIIFDEALSADDLVRVQHFYTLFVHPEYFKIAKFYDNIDQSQQLDTGVRGLSIGPMVIDDGVTLSIQDDSAWVIL